MYNIYNVKKWADKSLNSLSPQLKYKSKISTPKNNIVKLSEFLGEENDKEIVYLQLELIKLIVNSVDDVSTTIKDILKFIKIKKEEKQ